MSDEQTAAPQTDAPDAAAPDEQQTEYEAAFDEFSREPADADAEAEPEPEPEPEPAESGPALEDPLAGLTSAQREHFARMQSQIAAYEHEISSNRGRVSGLQRKIDELSRQQSGQQSGPRDADEKPNGVSQSKWDRFKVEFPEVAEAMEARVSALQEQLDQKIGQAQEPIRAMQERQALQSQYAALSAVHPDWQAAVKSSAFRTWVGQQPKAVQDMALNSRDAREASWVLTQFKQAVGTARPAEQRAQMPASQSPLAEKRSQRRKQAAGISAGRSLATPSGVPDDYEAAFDYYARKARA